MNILRPKNGQYPNTASNAPISATVPANTAQPRTMPGHTGVGGAANTYPAQDNYTTQGGVAPGANNYNAPAHPGPAPNTAGPHRSDIANKLDPRVDSKFVTMPGPAPTTAGPHRSDLLNKLDPRVDSDMDGSQTFGHPLMGNAKQGAPTTGMTAAGSHTAHGTHAGHGTHHAVPAGAAVGAGAAAAHHHNKHSVPDGTYGPHSSRLMNKLDPSVDSDADHRAAPAGYAAPTAGTRAGVGAHGASAPEGTYGPHSSRLGNALDPRVDSDADGSHGRTGYPATGPATGAAAPVAGGPAGTHPPHRSKIANILDPRVDSETANAALDANRTMHGAAGGPRY